MPDMEHLHDPVDYGIVNPPTGRPPIKRTTDSQVEIL